MAGTRCVPWHSWAEWGFVADAFLRLPEKDFDDDEKDDEKDDDDDEKKKTEKKRRAIELVQMWRTRGRVPVAVDAHAQIVELQLMDEEMMKKMMMMKKKNPHDDDGGEDKKETTTSSQQSESTLRLSYAMTLTRLVNGICDQSQKGKFAISVQTLATQLNVPRTLVDIRHDSTHNQLPSIQRLRKASEDAIEWLEVKYWERQKQKLERVVEEMRLAIRAMVECEKRQKKNKDGDADGDDADADGNKDSDSDDESMYDSEEEMHMKTEKANKMKKEKETRKKTKNSAMGRLKRLVPKSKPDQMLVRAFTRELLDAHADERNNLVATNTTTEKERGKNNNANRVADTVIVRAFSNVIEQIDSRVVNGFSCAVLEFGTEEVLHELANDARKIINPVFEFAWKHALRRDEAKAKFIAQWYQRRDGANTTTYVQKKFQMLMSSSLEDATDGGGGGSNNNNNNNNNKKNAKKHKRQQREKEDDTNNDTAAWRKAKPGEWVPGAPIGAPSRAIFVPREVVGGNNGVDKIVLELDAFTPRKKQKMERRNASFSYRKNELDLDLEYNEDEEDGDDRLHSFLQDADADDADADDADERGEEENEDAAKAKITVNGTRVRLNDRDVNGVKDNVACLL